MGVEAEYRAVLVGRGLRRAALFLGRCMARLLAPLAHKTARAARSVKEDLSAPVRRARSGASHIRELVADEKKNGLWHALRLGLQYFWSGVRAYGHLAKNLVYYLLPLGAGAVFVFTVVNVLDSQFALAVEYEGQVVGYVGQESVYEEAAQIVQNQLVYTGHEQEWKLHPTFSIAAAKPDELSDSQTLVDAILRSSGEEITEAVGL